MQNRGILWALDFDGTLSHLVPSRSAAVLDPDCRDCLVELAADPENAVAIVSSRNLADLEERIPLENVVLAGSSGLEWLLPNGRYLRPSLHTEARVARKKVRVLSALESIRPLRGVDVEDKSWSLAVHFRETETNDLTFILDRLENMRIENELTLYYGPSVAEIQLIEEVSKVTAARTLVRLFEHQFPDPMLIYAGDDQNDVPAMRWVLERKGIVFTVGDRIHVKGANVVLNPTELARALRQRFQPLFEGREER